MSSLMALPDADQVTARDRIVGAVSLVAAYLLLRLPFPAATKAVEFLGRGAPPASLREGESFVAAVRRAAHWFPGRAACLETSLGTVLAARLHGRRLDWCIGARTLPYAAHAWVEAEQQPIGEPPDRPYLLLQRV